MWFNKLIIFRVGACLLVAAMFVLMRTSGTGTNTPRIVPPISPVIEWTQEELKRDPNVIVILSEAFWDPTQIDGLKFSRDPIPMFHALKEAYTSGTMLSPQFGGGTANVELEVLTGNSVRFLPEGTIAYETVINHHVDSLAAILARQGYTSTVISPTENWFFDSVNVYRHFGFSRFISMEFFNPNEYVGPYIGDHAVGRRIIEESKRSGGADFIFANTMENHYHFYPGKFKSNTIDISGDAPGAALAMLETYAQGANGADAMLQELVQYYSKVKEPTIVVFFGDHLPYFDKDYYVYRETKYIEGEDDPQSLEKIHNVPVLVWNNYLNGPKDQLHISPSFLSPYILKLAKLKGTPYTDFLGSLSQRIPVIPPKSYYEAMHINEADLAPYEGWQERILSDTDSAADSGSGVSEQTESVNIDTGGRSDHPYILGYGDPVIQTVSPEVIQLDQGLVSELKKSTTVTVKGGRFGMGSTVFADGNPLQTTWLAEDSLSAVIPKEMYAKPGQLELEVRVVDEKENVLARSKPTVLPIAYKKQY
jgi:hypothetical protein